MNVKSVLFTKSYHMKLNIDVYLSCLEPGDIYMTPLNDALKLF